MTDQQMQFAAMQLVSQLETAVQQNDIKAAEDLLQRGADPNEKFMIGTNMLTEAARSGYTEIARLLVAHGADVNRKSSWGETPLINAAKGNHAELAALLIESGADINAQTDGGWSPLICAAYYDGEETVRLLIDRGADVTVKGHKGETAENHASGEKIEQLLRGGPELQRRHAGTEAHATAVEKQDRLKRLSVRSIIRGLQP